MSESNILARKFRVEIIILKYFLVLPYIFHINFGKGVGSHFQFRIHLCQYMSGRLFHAVKISILIGSPIRSQLNNYILTFCLHKV